MENPTRLRPVHPAPVFFRPPGVFAGAASAFPQVEVPARGVEQGPSASWMSDAPRERYRGASTLRDTMGPYSASTRATQARQMNSQVLRRLGVGLRLGSVPAQPAATEPEGIDEWCLLVGRVRGQVNCYVLRPPPRRAVRRETWIRARERVVGPSASRPGASQHDGKGRAPRES